MESIKPSSAAIPASAAVRPVLEGRAEIAGQVLALATGASVEANVVGRLTREVVLLDVAGQLFQTTLPEGALQEGDDKLPLVVLRGGDKPAFLLDRRTVDSGPAPSARVDLSDAGSRLGAAVAAATRGREAAPPAVVSAGPLLPAPPADSQGLVPPLRQAVEGSGLFYESHQAEWVAGRRPLEALRAEPQAVAGRLAVPADDSAGEGVTRVDAASHKSMEGVVSEARLPSDTPAAPVPAIAQLVDRQLQTLSGQPILWTGQVWPGQSMEWQIEEDRSDDAGEGPSQAWMSKLRLTLPNLGAVELRVGLRNEQLVVRVVSGADHVTTFRDSAEALRTALSARGLRLTALEVGPHGDDA